MSQTNNASNNQALQRTLQQSLNEVLMEVSFGGDFLGGPTTTASAFHLPQNSNLSALNMPGLGGAAGNGFLPAGATNAASVNASALAALGGLSGGTTASFLSQQAQNQQNALAALGGAGTACQLRPSEALGMSTEELLLAAATEKRMIEQRARQQDLAQKTLESRRRYQESLLALMKGNTAGTTNLVGVANPHGLIQQGLLQQFKQPVPAAAAVPALAETESKTAIKVLGTSLRKKDSPYLDVSRLKDPDVSDKRTRGGVTDPFPERLHRLLNEVEKDGKDDIVSFFSHGRAFAVHDPDRFTSEVMPKYFKQSRLSSFQRQLNLYGFTRITSGPDAGGYYHELFLKGRPNLAVHMRRVGLPQGEDRRKMRAKNMRSEPNFYAMGNVKDAKVVIPGMH